MISKLAIRRNVTTWMMTMVVFLGGILAYLNLDMELMPEMDIPIAVVSTTYVGAGPEEIETLVTEPLEESLSTVANVDTVTSVSSSNASMVLVQFVDGTDIDIASMDMREVLDRVKSELPDDAGEPNIIKMDLNALPITLGVTAENMDLTALNEMLEENVVNRLERIEGVASVDLVGGVEREVRITIDPDKMAGYGISATQLAQVLAAENMNLPSGSLSQGSTTVQVRTLGEFENIEEIRNLPITTASGGLIHLSDVASVEEMEVDRDSFSIIDGNYGIMISVNKQSTANLVDVSDKLNQEMASINADYPELEMVMLTDTANYIEMSLSNVTETALLSAVIAFFVLLVFLKNMVTSLIIAMSIPTSIMATFALMYATGMSMNVISMGGLAIGIGMLVDNSVVVLDSIYQYYERGYSATEAAETGAKEMTMAVTASTLTTVAVFLPIAFVGGSVGQLMNSLSFTICFSLISSLVVSVTFVPMASAMFLRRESTKKKRKHKLLRRISYAWDVFFDRLNGGYEKLIRAALYHPRRTIVIVLAAFLGSLCTIPITGVDFMDETDEGVANISIEMPNGTDLDTTEETVWEALYRLQDIPEVELMYASVGGSMLSSGTSSATITMNLVDKTQRERSTQEVCEEVQTLLQSIPGAEITASASSSAMGSFGGADISFNVYGYDSETLIQVEDDLVELLSNTPGLTEVEGSTGETVPEARVIIDRNKASLYGITTASIASSLNTAISGSTATQYKMDGTEIDVVIRYDTQELNYLTDLNNITVTSAYGGEIPLSSIAAVEMSESATSITRENQKNYITIEASANDLSGNEAQRLVEETLAGYEFPDGCTYDFGGTLEMMNEAMNSLLTALVVAVLLVYMIMASQFESLRYPAIIMFAMPLAFTGAILGLFITGNTITMTAMMGFVMLAGVVVNNGIVLVDYTNQLMGRGMRCYEALVTAGPRRLRPILMTTLTTILGMVPMVLSQSEGSEKMRTMALSVIFGLSLSSLVTLVFIPVLYAWMNSRKEKRLAKKAAKRAEREAKEAETAGA
ncbi:MAG TPA: efflux RND transporter permease subunit [Candidatus Anaerotignum merdipullorum]|nr:efflux RND transporter permease subunit [Candidatus Anaerotignum merdipullorum]